MNNLHPTIAFALLPLIPVPLPVIYRARIGRKRAFHSAADVVAYERGYNRHPLELSAAVVVGSPEWMGWMDAEEDAEAHRLEAAERRRERQALREDLYREADDMGDYAATHLREIGVHL